MYFLLKLDFSCRTFTCNGVFLHCCIGTFTAVKDLSTSSTAAADSFYRGSCDCQRSTFISRVLLDKMSSLVLSAFISNTVKMLQRSLLIM